MGGACFIVRRRFDGLEPRGELNHSGLDAPPGDSVRPLRVLLYSPVPRFDPLSGDTTYTETLIAHPPPGVEYTAYPDALADGRLVRRGRRPRNGVVTPTDVAILGLRALEKAARGVWMFPRRRGLSRPIPPLST